MPRPLPGASSPVQPSTERHWLPKSISYRFGEPIVDLAEIRGPLGPFFSDLDLRRARTTRRLPLMDVDVSDVEANAQPTGFIYHLPRSGSTLFARMLATLPSAACVVEPEAVNALLSGAGAPEAVNPDWLRRLCLLYGAAFAGTHEHVFMKLSSWVILREPLFAEALPGVRGCFVHRDTAEVAVQVLQRPTGWMSDRARNIILEEDPHVASLSAAEYCARALGRFCAAALAGGPRVHPVAYEAYPEVVPETTVGLFGVAVGEPARQAMIAIARYDSDDWSVQRNYDAGSAKLGESATPELKRLLRRFAEPPRRQLLERSGR